MFDTNPATLHLHYELEKPGYHGLDRRHFPEKNRFALSESVYKPRGRAHIPSPPLKDEQWRPHGKCIEPKYSDFGPDWHSRLRYIKSPRNPDAKPTLPVAVIEENLHFVRPFPQNWQRSTNEWIYFTDESADHRPSKRNFFANIHLRSIEDLGDEDVHMKQIGHKRNALTKRSSEGEKSYRRAELEPDFHKFGSTLPPVNFGHVKKYSGSGRRSVPMKNETIHIIDDKEFEKKQRERERELNVQEVIQLDQWKPADILTSAFKVFASDSTDKRSGKYRSHFR